MTIMKLSHFILAACIALGISVLTGLGIWQIQRLDWKEGLIKRVQQNLDNAPLTIEQIEQLRVAGEDFEYRPAIVSGTFDHSKEQHFFAPYKGQSGYFIYTPLTRENGQIVFINRGFVPYEIKEPGLRAAGQVGGIVTVKGLARSAPKERPNSAVYDNDLEKNVFHWKSITQMFGRAYDKTNVSRIPFFIDAGDETNPGGLPVGGVTRISFPNSHLQYAVTWFGLALALLCVGGYFLFTRVRQSDEANA